MATPPKLADIRRSYTQAALTLADVGQDPVAFFQRWFEEARQSQALEPNACCLATASETGKPSARFVLLKGIDPDGFVFFTNYESRKAQELEANPWAAMTFFWAELERQVRIEGQVERATPEQNEAYFQSRPRGSQLGAWASPQSQILHSREQLEKRHQDFEARFSDMKIIPVPGYWGGYKLRPLSIEFWQGRPNRLHDRLFFTHEEEGRWSPMRLAP